MVSILDSLLGKNKMTSAAPETDMAQLEQALGGNWAAGLSGSDKLATLGALLKSVSRGSTTTPQQVMQQAQKGQLERIQGQMQLQQLRASAAQAAKDDLAIANFAARLSAEDKAVFDNLSRDEKLKYVTKNLGGGEANTAAMKNYNWVMGAETPEERKQRYAFIQAQNPQYLGSATTGYQVVQPTTPGFIAGPKAGDQKWVMGENNQPVKAYYVNGVDGLGWYDNPEGK